MMAKNNPAGPSRLMSATPAMTVRTSAAGGTAGARLPTGGIPAAARREDGGVVISLDATSPVV
jgi:hypothetical protein